MIEQIATNSLISGSIYALIAITFALIYRTVRFFHLAHGAVYTVGAYAAYTVVKGLPVESYALRLAVGVITGMMAAALSGVAVDRMVYFPLRKRKASDLILLLASFGVFIFIQNLIQLIYGAQILTIREGPVKEGHHVLGAVITDVQITIILVSLFCLFLLWSFVQHTKLGKAMRAVADNPVAASTVGIDPERTIFWAFLIGSGFAGLAGMLISLETNLEPTMGFSAILKGMIASIVGGIGSLPGAVLGAYFLGIVENFGIWKISVGWKDAISFAVLIVFLLVRPQGLLGVREYREEI